MNPSLESSESKEVIKHSLSEGQMNLLYLLKCFTSLFIALTLFHFLSYIGTLNFLGAMSFYALGLILILAFLIIFKAFRIRRRFDVPVLILLLLLGISGSSMYGHHSTMKYMKNNLDH